MQFGIKDEEFIRGKVPMTKAEIRAMVMVKAAIQPGDIVADIGAGTGSLSIEAALCCPAALEVVTTARIQKSTSSETSSYVSPCAPSMSTQLPT